MVVIALPRPVPTSGSVPKANSARLAAPSLSGSFVGPLWGGTVFRFVAAQSLKNCAPFDDDSAREHNTRMSQPKWQRDEGVTGFLVKFTTLRSLYVREIDQASRQGVKLRSRTQHFSQRRETRLPLVTISRRISKKSHRLIDVVKIRRNLHLSGSAA